MTKINKIAFIFLLHLGIVYDTCAQASVTPLRHSQKSKTSVSETWKQYNNSILSAPNQRIKALGDTVSLPFADNFDNAKSLNTALWQANSNVLVSDSAGNFFFKSNTITLDGSKSSGTGYNTSNIYGKGDSIVSKPINLNATSNTYLSFYWQAGGLFDAPDSTKFDSLVVSFYTPNSKQWVNALVLKSAIKMVTDFKFATIKIADSLLYNGFQFKFQSFGNSSGRKDAWNIDYIKLDKDRTATDSVTLGYISLPFIDDFTSNHDRLNTTLWTKSGVTINNTNAINPPTTNVVTFDGIDSTGSPYNFNNGFAYGPCDQLISQPINLFGLTAKDSVYFSFYWQAGGFVELPDSVQTDSLSVFFKTKVGRTWAKVWTYMPDKDSLDPTQFNFVAIKVPDSLMYNGSQFKIQSFGNQSGAWDNWHIDYVKLDSNRSKNDARSKDFSLNNINYYNTLFKKYTAITSEQFKGFEAQELMDTIKINLFNFINATTSSIKIHSDFKNNNTIIDSSNYLVLEALPFPKFYTQKIGVDKSKFLNLPDSCNISNSSFLVDGIKLNDIIRNNDTLKITSKITNYLAYDDGSAEGAFGINQAAGRVLYKIKLNRPDTISAVDIAWVKSVVNLEGTTFKLLLMPTLNSIQFSKQLLVGYGDSLNAFTRYTLDSGIIVKDSFYIGYEQNSDVVLTVGYDKNTTSNLNILYGTGYIPGTSTYHWRPFTQVTGSLMMRPIFERGVKTSKDRKANPPVNDILLYPNPSQGLLTAENDTIDQLKVFSLIGNEIQDDQYSLSSKDKYNRQTINLTKLESGFYILFLYHSNTVTSKKVFIQP